MSAQVATLRRIRPAAPSPSPVALDFALHDAAHLSHLTNEELRCLERLGGQASVVRESQHVARQGDPFEFLYAVRSGAFKGYSCDSQGREHIRGFFMQGQIIGFSAFCTGRYCADFSALETSSVIAIPVMSLDELSGSIPHLQTRLMMMMSEKLRRAACLAGEYTAEERLAAFLASLSRRFNERGLSATRLHLPMSRRDIGNYLRLAPETVSRVLAHFVKTKLIEIHDREVTVLALATLQELGASLGQI